MHLKPKLQLGLNRLAKAGAIQTIQRNLVIGTPYPKTFMENMEETPPIRDNKRKLAEVVGLGDRSYIITRVTGLLAAIPAYV